MAHPCLVVLTARGPGRILEQGGSQAWRLKPENASRHEYIVCVQNRHNGLWGGADQPHHRAFLVGRISSVEPSGEAEGRYIVKFSEYARIDCENAWPGLRNPVHYADLEDFGIADPAMLDWLPMPPPAVEAAQMQAEDEVGISPLTIAEAKTGLALGLGVPESAIEIVVRF